MSVTETRVNFPTARSRGVGYQGLLDADTHEVPAVLRMQNPFWVGSDDKPVSRYTSRDFHDLEKEKLWKRTWQMACREEDIPDVGDTIVYDITDMSFLVVRSAPDRIQAYWNACLHRGRILKEFDGHVDELRCPFHGYCWNLDGSLKQVPAAWDFPQVEPDQFHLPEVQVGTWGGFVFINPDTDAEPFADHAKGLDEQFERWPLDRRYKQAHVAKIVRGELEGRAGSLHGGVPRRGHPPAAPGWDWRRELCLRRVEQLQPGDHPERNAEPAHQLGARRADQTRRDDGPPAR